MLLFPMSKHEDCTYPIIDKDNMSFNHIFIKEGEIHTFNTLSNSYYLFFIRNNKSVKIHKNHKCYIQNSSIFLESGIESFRIEAISDTFLIVHCFDYIINICNQNFYEEFPKNISTNRIIKIKEPIKQYLELLLIYLDNESCCRHVNSLKHKELFLIFRKFYSKQEYMYLFKEIINDNLIFKRIVRDNYMKVKNIEELATLCNKSLSTFIRLFKKYFNDNPHNWIKEEKLKLLNERILENNVPFFEIIEEFHFSSFSYFSHYCKIHLGKSPKELRKSNLTIND
jgi:AraC-like DNA-binding protein